jgi:G:T-mismatch repair DNA endonuclease (very short patch repair protein)
METMYKNGEFTRFCKHNYSNSELKFVNDLLSHYKPSTTFYCALPDNKQFFRHFKDEGITLAYDFVCEKKIIEFNGDYWHCNPFIYEPTYFHKFMKCTAQEKWDIDKKKIELIKKAGYEVLVIWESEYQENKELTINKCIEYLTN